MRVLMVSYTSLLQRAYRKKCDVVGREAGVELTVLTPPYWKEAWAPEACVEFEPEEDAPPYRRMHAPVLFPGNGHISLFRAGVRRVLAESRPDVIDLEREPWSWAAGQMLWFRNRLCPGARIIFHASQNAMKRYPPPFRQIEKAVYAGSAAALARTEAAAAVLRTRGFRRTIHVLPHGVDTDRFSPGKRGEPPEERVVGFVGALTRQKGVDILLEAMNRLRIPARCLIVGDGPERRRLEAHARSLGIDSRVEFAGALPHDEIPAVFGRMRVFVLPAVSLPGLEERFGRVLLEAMASGVPVVASDSGEIPSVVGDGGRIVPQGDPAALAGALEEMLEDRSRAGEMGRLARSRALERFSWDVVGRRTLAVYEEVLRPREPT